MSYLIDYNTIIDFFNNKLPTKGVNLLMDIVPSISIITRIELFCKGDILKTELDNLNRFIEFANVVNIDEQIALYTIDIRVEYKVKIPDVLIGATALSKDLVLITRNTADFSRIKKLNIIDPYNL